MTPVKHLAPTVFCFAAAYLGYSSSAVAAGFQLCLLSEELTGNACTGRAVGVGHPDAFDNPATLAAFDSPTLTAGGRLIILDSKFDPATPSPQGGGDGGNAGKIFPLPTMHAAAPISDKVRVGVSIVAPFGLGLEYDDAWAGRYFVQEISLTTINATVGASYRVDPTLDLGVGFSVQYGTAKLRRAINNVFDGLPDGQFELSGDGIATGWNVGAIWRPTATIEIGVVYRSHIEQELEGSAEVRGVGPTLAAFGIANSKGAVTLDLPRQVVANVAFKIGADTRFVAEADWTDWSSFRETRLSLESGFVETTPRNWRDTHRFGLALEQRLDADWKVRVGAAYETSAVTDGNRLPDIPTDRWWGIAAGAQRRISERAVITMSVARFDLGDNRIDVNGGLSGTLSGRIRQKDLVVGIGANLDF
jgi:long-chain fatty acid transport protein